MSIILRPITIDDTENIIRWRNNVFVLQNFIDRNVLTVEKHKKWIQDYILPGKAIQMIISISETHKDIGSVFLKNIDSMHYKAEFGIFIGEENELGKGYGLAAIKQMISYAFAVLKLHKLYLRVLKTNQSAISVYEKAGFRQIGTFKDDVLVNNNYLDVIFMEIINKN